MRIRQPATNELIKTRVAEFVRTKNLIEGCVRAVFSTPPGEDPPLLSAEEFLRREIFGHAEPDLLTRRQQLEQIRSALRDAEIEGQR
jgi:hypothetical protein